MEYSINKLAKLAGVSTRTLRYYDEIELLSPRRISSNGYRMYGQKEVYLLQLILFYRELAQKVCALHKEWLEYFWNHYSKEAHLGLAQTYVDDPRFKKYYDAIAVVILG